ncbi:MAG TPA: hypothetical protein VFL19_01725 [Nitrospira sp.]|nr:hypothetical protein [Nitrospira sp.]
MRRISPYGIMLVLAGMMFINRCHHPVPSSAAVEMASGIVGAADQAVEHELAAAFERAETAVQHADLASLMLFYEKDYNYHGLKRSDVERVWAEVFDHYRHIRSKHVFTELKVVHAGSMTKAFVTCTGGLYGVEKESGKPVTIDSWVNEVHHLVKEGSAWKFLGNVGGEIPQVPATSAPHHPLF